MTFRFFSFTSVTNPKMENRINCATQKGTEGMCNIKVRYKPDFEPSMEGAPSVQTPISCAQDRLFFLKEAGHHCDDIPSFSSCSERFAEQQLLLQVIV